MRSTASLGTALALVCLVLVGAGPACCSARDLRALSDSPQWNRLAGLWQALLDHSSQRIYSPSLFQGLAGDVSGVDATLSELAQGGALPRPVADYLARLFHARYQYLAQSYYTTRSSVSESPFEASRTAALWVVELQLAVLRRPAASKADAELAEAAEANLIFQLTYLRHLDEFASQVDDRRVAMKKREEAGEKVDWKAFDADVERRQGLLLEAYRNRKLPPAEIVHRSLPYILALTRLEVSGQAPGLAGG
ncbi:MAG: hypothetical protein ACE149_12410 [Armatimonadota bacterium]